MQKMISIKKFLSIVSLMVVTFLLLQVPVLVKERANNYNINRYVRNTGINSENVWKASSKDPVAFFIGKSSSPVKNMMEIWSGYRRYALKCADSVEDIGKDQYNIMVIDLKELSPDKAGKIAKTAANNGKIVVLAGVENALKKENNKELKESLGIYKVRDESVKTEGVHLYDGFLLGGEAIYKPKDQKEYKERMDLDEKIPWLTLNSGTKIFAVGLLPDEMNIDKGSIGEEWMPPLFWRYSYGDGFVYGIIGDYMEEVSGVGILDAIISDVKSYDIYPVVNAQNLTVLNFPTMADENTAVLTSIYSMPLTKVMSELVCPELYNLNSASSFRMTCMMTTQYDYKDEVEPTDCKQWIKYLKMMNEDGWEPGLSMYSKSDISAENKFLTDFHYIKKTGSKYPYSSIYANDEEVSKGARQLDSIITASVPYNVNLAPFGLSEDNLSLQRITDFAFHHTYKDDIRTRCFETALAYTNILYDMENIAFPVEMSDQIEYYIEQCNANIATYWKPFAAFQKTVLSESDERVRRFLNLTFTESRKGNTINLTTDEQTYFILRTHGEEVESVAGGTCDMIEEGAYLLYSNGRTMEITLENEN